MKRLFLVSFICCAVWISGCNKDTHDGEEPALEAEKISLREGSIVINNRPDVKIVQRNQLLERSATGNDSEAITRKDYQTIGRSTLPFVYNFKLVAEMGTLKVDGVEVQATHVKISEEGYAFVSYNKKDGPRIGGVVVYKYDIHGNTLADVSVEVTAVTSLEMNESQVNALDFYNGKLFIAGSSTDERLGFNDDKGYNCAFFMVLELNTDNTFKPVDPESIVFLTSFQATSIRVENNRIYVITGDGSEGTQGGLHIYDATTFECVNSILGLDNARSVDVYDEEIYVMQAMPARITKYNLDGEDAQQIYASADEAMQKNAKSDLIVTGHGVFAAMNESGLKMISHFDGWEMASRERPGPNPENDVTNSVSMNYGPMKNNAGETVRPSMLLVANGAQGVYWYDIIWDLYGTFIKETANNSILKGSGSSNYVEAKGNIAFVANGLGGLKVLYLEPEKPPTPITTVVFRGFDYVDGLGEFVHGDNGVYSQAVELDKEGEIDWDAVYNAYKNYQWTAEFDEEWIIGWEVTSSDGTFEFAGKRPDDAFTELMLDHIEFRINGKNIIYIRAILEKPELRSMYMTMTTAAQEVNLGLMGTGKITIDWGDGTMDEHMLSGSIIYPSREYATTTERTITITGDDLYYVVCEDNQLTKLDVSKNTALIVLFCGRNQLTELDISNNTELMSLYISRNQLTGLDATDNAVLLRLDIRYNLFTDVALNELFGTLNSFSADPNSIPSYKSVDIYGNPGADTCDPTIATIGKGGWFVFSTFIDD